MERVRLLIISFATSRLHGVCNGGNNRMEDGDGGTHSSPTAMGLGIKAPQPKFPSFVWDWEGAQKCFILRDQTTGLRSFKIPSFTSPSHTHSPVCAPTATFSFSKIVGKVSST